ncbi:hybrid sensor histidine kinase/response regulator [Aerosakkonema funiforme]|uniref:hybrid sensor histidine kinase/response regulator n=1 Tax=Aerosakkonema funiforme TaxID=1246630 RepID=UPI0035B6FFC5
MTIDASKKSIILVIDDSPTNLEVLCNFLDESGFEVWSSLSGEKALQRLKIAQPDLILLDVVMPGKDGFEICRSLKKNSLTQDIPVIFMTALANTTDKIKGLKLGAVDYITKPFQAEEVLVRLELHLRLRNLTKALATKNEQLKVEIKERQAVETTLRELQQDLEQRVEARTAELKEAQVWLVQSEKIASLGQLVAGIAHEVNNPVNFIVGNLGHIDRYFEDLIDLLNLYQKYLPEPPTEVIDKIEQIELKELLSDLPKVLNSMHIGASRILDLSSSLRNFSRLDDAGKKVVNIHEGIESTLLILGHRLKARPDFPGIKVIKEYGEFPLVECYPGQLNQVFMNLIANAIDALEDKIRSQNIDDKYANYQPMIQIKTEVIKLQVLIHIIDNGPGISEEFQQQVFAPFFTTKPPGKGTGLGLSISQKIVVINHSGQLTCSSVIGQGTEFVIKIPI